MSQDQNAELNFKPVNSKLKGVGGWLLFFVIGQMILRPLRTWAELSDPKNMVTPLVEQTFPTTAAIIGVERVIGIGLALLGILVGLMLWKVRTPLSVKVTKIFLILNPILVILDVLAYRYSDLPPRAQDEVMQKGLIEVVVVIVICLIWFLYFTKSERVRATYYDEVASLGLR